MKFKTTVKVMNFHALLRVNKAKEKAENAIEYENRLKYIISSIVNNHIFKMENISLEFPKNKKSLNIYIGSDLGFCSGMNADIIKELKNDSDENDKIIVGKKIVIPCKNIIYKTEKEGFNKNYKNVYDIVLNGILENKYSEVNVIYIHYYNINEQVLKKKTIIPFDISKFDDDDKYLECKFNEDYSVEGDIEYIMWNLVANYVSAEIRIAEYYSWASENIQRQKFTNESLKKIEEKEEEQLKIDRKQKNFKSNTKLVENNNKNLFKRRRNNT